MTKTARPDGRMGAHPDTDDGTGSAARTLVVPSRAGMTLPSEAFVGNEAITHGEWLRRHAATYGDRGAVEWREVAVLAVLALCALVGLALLLVGAFDGGLGTGVAR